MNRHPALFLFLFLSASLLLNACENRPVYSPPKPQIAQTAPNTIANTAPSKAQDPKQAQPQQPKELPSVKIGILLPLSGKHELLGQSMLKAAQMALFDLGHSNFELIPRDTMGRADTARSAAQDAIENGAQIILGPVFSSAAKAVQPVAQSYRINMISFSTDWTVAGRHSYIMGFSPFDQVERIVEFASQKNMRDIGVIIPNSAYGNAVRSAFRSSAARNRINTIKTIEITPGNSSVTASLRDFADYDRRIADRQREVTVMGGHAHTKAQEELPYEAVFMPLGGTLARSVSNMLSQYDLPASRVKRLGTGLWDDPSLAAEPAMDGAWFASPNPRASDRFREKFEGIYGYEPPRLTTLAYDATALAGVLARKGLINGNQPAFDQASITNPNGFAGIDGIFRFGSNGVVERGLAILEFKGGEIQVIDPAPKTFISQNKFQPSAGNNLSRPQPRRNSGQYDF